ncbi:ras-responsive element-binding protein 1 [Protopterus annectens]|uniref:ras-responsive element-binding protein 1 n=1 Tax=Protopterus annectens TaxID=7888 RepID=UPI001CFA508D|nr:ras-responsive element-binding protein 1 [Protopterus annectens]
MYCLLTFALLSKDCHYMDGVRVNVLKERTESENPASVKLAILFPDKCGRKEDENFVMQQLGETNRAVKKPEGIRLVDSIAATLPSSSESADLSSIKAMMSAVMMGVEKLADNGSNSPSIRTPSKSPGPNRIGRRNQESKEEKSSYICPLCEKVCPSQHLLTMHIRQHNSDTGGSDHSCSICGKSLSSASSLDRHMLVHSGERPYRCSVCSQSFTTNGNMHRHMKIHEKDPSNIVNPNPPSPLKRKRLPFKRKFSQDEELEKEEQPPAKKVMEEKFEENEKNELGLLNCPMCFVSCECRSSLEAHMETHSDIVLRCDVCSITFRTHRGLLCHNSKVHRLIPVDPLGRPFIQNNPSVPAGFQDLAFADFSSTKFSLTCQVWCEVNLRRCTSEVYRFICDTCNKAFPMFSALELHLKTHNAVQKDEAVKPFDEDGDQKAYMQSLGLCHTKEISTVNKQEPLSDIEILTKWVETPKSNLPQESSSTTLLNLSPLKAASAGSLFPLFSPKQDNRKLVPLQPFQKGFIIQPEHIVVKPVSSESHIEFADIQQILKMASSVPPQISLPLLSKAPSTHTQSSCKQMPQLKPKPLVEHQPVVAVSAPPPATNIQQASPGCISPNLPNAPANQMDRPESACDSRNIKPKSGVRPNRTPQVFQHKIKSQLVHNSITKVLLPLGMEAKIKQEAEGDHKGMMTVTSNKKSLAMRKVLYPCRFCSQVFAFSGVLRAHIRSHLGISPYQCNICDYIAADKAALIRHLRTHSGERPYICKICHYPFTVKANCERHLRKKHLKLTRKEIEKNIEYVTSNTPEMVDAFCSPDTVCRHCGEDLKHYRALQAHMKNHMSCQKTQPFECKECNATFSAKRICMHHILKQHSHVHEKAVENHISAVDCRAEENGSESPHSDDSAFTDSQPHSDFLQGARVMTSVKNDFTMDEPLDFSQKSVTTNSVHMRQDHHSSSPHLSQFDFSMEPLDLSVPKIPRRDKCIEAVEVKKEQQLNDSETHSCDQLCSSAFTAKGINDKHLTVRQHQPVNAQFQLTVPIIPHSLISGSNLLRPLKPKPPPLLPKPVATKELPPLASIAQIISSVSSASSLLKSESSNQNIPPALSPAGSEKSEKSENLNCKPSFMAVTEKNTSINSASKLVPDSLLSSELFSLDAPHLAKKQKKVKTKTKTKAGGGTDLESSGEFASIEKMLATTDTNKFSPYLQSSEDNTEEPDKNSTSEDEKETTDKVLRGRKNAYSGSMQKITCPYCPRVFPWASSLQRHMLTHTGQKPYPCQKCDAFFSTKSNCERHLLRKHGVASRMLRRNGVLSSCKEGDSGSHDSADSHSDPEAMPPTSATTVLDLTLQENSKVKEIQQSDQQQQFKEQKHYSSKEEVEGIEEKSAESEEGELDEDAESNKSLDLNFASKLMDFKLAEGSHGRGETPEKKTKNTCSVCGKCFKFAATLSRHKKVHVAENEEDRSNKTVNGLVHETSDMLQDLPVSSVGSDAALGLKEQIPRSNSVDSHEEKLENEQIESNSEGETLDRANSERSDDDKEPKTNPSANTSKADKRKKLCVVCNKRFWSLQDLTRHMRSHTGERPYKCQTCERTFTLKHSLVRHQRIHQKGKDAKNHKKVNDTDGAQSRCEDSENESVHSNTNPVSESEGETGSMFGLVEKSPLPESQKVHSVTRPKCFNDKSPAQLASSNPFTEANKGTVKGAQIKKSNVLKSLGGSDGEVPSTFIQGLLKSHEKTPRNHHLSSTESAPQLLGVE